jgi:hypothetical protein
MSLVKTSDGFSFTYVPIHIAKELQETILSQADEYRSKQVGRIPNQYLKGKEDGFRAAADLVERLIAVAEENPLKVSESELLTAVKLATGG